MNRPGNYYVEMGCRIALAQRIQTEADLRHSFVIHYAAGYYTEEKRASDLELARKILRGDKVSKDCAQKANESVIRYCQDMRLSHEETDAVLHSIFNDI